MTLITPNWTDLGGGFGVALVSTQLNRENVSSATLDLRTKFGAFLMLRVGRVGTTPPITFGMEVRVNRKPTIGTIVHPATIASMVGGTATPAMTTITVDSAIGDMTIFVASNAGFAHGDYIFIYDGSSSYEFARVRGIGGGAAIKLDAGLQFAHLAVSAVPVTNQADIYAPLQCPGGSVYEVIFDYGGAESAGSDMYIEAIAQRYDSDTLA